MRPCLAPGLREDEEDDADLAGERNETTKRQVISCNESHVDLTGHHVSPCLQGVPEGERSADLGEDQGGRLRAASCKARHRATTVVMYKSRTRS
eukprot:1849637-Heterocapsa_arctica.AAC.1